MGYSSAGSIETTISQIFPFQSALLLDAIEKNNMFVDRQTCFCLSSRGKYAYFPVGEIARGAVPV
jgi:hypothetical protein